MDDIVEDVDRRVKELLGWVRKGTQPRRVLYLEMSLYDIVSMEPIAKFPEAWKVLTALEDAYDMGDAAEAIFSGEELTGDKYKRYDAPPGGFKRLNGPDSPASGGSWGQAGLGGIPPVPTGETGPGKRRRKTREGASEYKREAGTHAAGPRFEYRDSLHDHRED